jgi:hypothetical protein
MSRRATEPTEAFGASSCSGRSFVLSPAGRCLCSAVLLMDCTIPPRSMHECWIGFHPEGIAAGTLLVRAAIPLALTRLIGAHIRWCAIATTG